MYCIFSCSEGPHLRPDSQGAWVGLVNCLAARNLVLNFALFSVGFSTENTFKLNKRTAVYKLPWGAIYKPPCMQFINNPFLAIHQVFLRCQKNSGKNCPNRQML